MLRLEEWGHARRALDVDVVVALAKGHDLPLGVFVQVFFEVNKALVEHFTRVQQRVQIGHDAQDELFAAQHLVNVGFFQQVLVYGHLAEVFLNIDYAAVWHQQILQHILFGGADSVGHVFKRAAALHDGCGAGAARAHCGGEGAATAEARVGIRVGISVELEVGQVDAFNGQCPANVLLEQMQQVAHEVVALLSASREENVWLAGYNRKFLST